jgi:thymidylate synthase
MRFRTSQDAFEFLYDRINKSGTLFAGTRAIFNCGFYIENPQDNYITTPWRKWSNDYAEYEWQWYLSGNRNADDIALRAPIWKNMQDDNGDVNSNYGYQWNRNGQLSMIINELIRDPQSRKASLSIYDGKEFNSYHKDTPCTLSISFYILNNKLEMSVLMRSNDLVFGFCNDQYCFSKLQKLVADQLLIKCGGYYHYAINMHIYERHFNMKEKRVCKECSKLISGRIDKLFCGVKCRSKYHVNLEKVNKQKINNKRNENN